MWIIIIQPFYTIPRHYSRPGHSDKTQNKNIWPKISSLAISYGKKEIETQVCTMYNQLVSLNPFNRRWIPDNGYERVNEYNSLAYTQRMACFIQKYVTI